MSVEYITITILVFTIFILIKKIETLKTKIHKIKKPEPYYTLEVKHTKPNIYIKYHINRKEAQKILKEHPKDLEFFDYFRHKEFVIKESKIGKYTIKKGLRNI
jgi:hypothetical protein